MDDTPRNWLLKWEVTNFADHIYHTDQLSIIRGGSELAEQAAEEIAALARRRGATPVYVAASQALFEVNGKTRAEIGALARELEECSVASALQLTSAAGFAPAPGQGDEDLKHAIWKCERAIELRRARLLNVHPGAGRVPQGQEADLDDFDHVRLADAEVRPSPSDEPQPVSGFSKTRYERGRQRQRRLAELLRRHTPGLASAVRDIHGKPADFQSLAACGALGNLIGLVQADGMGFTKIRQSMRSVDELRTFSKRLKAFLEGVVASAIAPDLDDWVAEKFDALPIHILLSAGDEFVLVCRAERALAIAAAIHDAAQNHPVTLPDGKETPLSFSVGVVVAHNATPIRILKRAAGELEHSAKGFARRREKDAGKPIGATAFAVFKGVAVSDRGVEALREDLFTLRLGDGTVVRLWHGPYAPDQLRRTVGSVAQLAGEASHGQLQRFLRDVPRAWRHHPPSGVVDLRRSYLDAVAKLPTLARASQDFLASLADGLIDERPADDNRPVVLPLADLDDLLTLARGAAQRQEAPPAAAEDYPAGVAAGAGEVNL